MYSLGLAILDKNVKEADASDLRVGLAQIFHRVAKAYYIKDWIAMQWNQGRSYPRPKVSPQKVK
jgi:hypothetical protein